MFLVGLALQLPVALVVVVLTGAVLAVGHALARDLSVPRAPRPRCWPLAPPCAVPLAPARARPPVLATGHGGRAPPGLPVA